MDRPYAPRNGSICGGQARAARRLRVNVPVIIGAHRHGIIRDIDGRSRMFYTLNRAVKVTGLKNEGKYAASTAAAGNAATLEAEIAALIRDAGETLRGKPDGRRCDIEQIAFQLPAADRCETGEYSARLPKNIDHMVKDAGLERPRWDPEIRISDAERLSPSDVKGTRRALVAGAILGTLGIGCILAYMLDRPVSTPVTRVDPEWKPRLHLLI
jgi:hypothetical protein